MSYRIDPPFYVSFSGGRTSGYMLRMILDAWGGSLPPGCHVLFANTGREHPATLQFVHEVSSRWVPVTWLEWVDARPEKTFRIVDIGTASRNGEPFEALIRRKRYLPNPIARFCTEELKVLTMQRFLRSTGADPAEVTAVIGLRADEERRVRRIRGDPTRNVAMPLADAGVTRPEVERWWSRAEFDLALPHGDAAFGNCDLCFLKSRDRTDRVMLEDPSTAEWWSRMEEEVGGTFRKDRPTYRQMLVQVTSQGRLFSRESDDTMPCDCTE